MKQIKRSQIRLTEEQKELFKEVAKYSLGILATGAIISITMIAPNSLMVLKPFLNKAKRFDKKDYIKISQKLVKDRLVEIIDKDDGQFLKITQKGKKQIIDFEIDTINIKKGKWDGRWRIVMFDIPEKYKFARNVLREKLREIGFVKIQKSVWISPYESQNEISFISSVFEVERYVNYARLDYVDCQDSLKIKFNL